MSIESARAFMDSTGRNGDLRVQLGSADTEGKFFSMAKEAGFDFTKEEWHLCVSGIEMSICLRCRNPGASGMKRPFLWIDCTTW